jgi:hypothetical protein
VNDDECDLCLRTGLPLERRLTPLDGFLWMCGDCAEDSDQSRTEGSRT